MVSLSKAQPSELSGVDSYVHVETRYNIWLSFRPAGPAPRLWAYVIDFFIRVAIFIVLLIVASFLSPLNMFAGLPMMIPLLGYFFLDMFYGCFFEWIWRGRTPGKRAMKLKVIKVGGYPITFVDAFLRNVLRVADALPVGNYGIGFASMLATRRMQRLGDLVAGTFVVHEEREVVRGYPPWIYGVPVIPTTQRSTAYKPSDRTLDIVETFLTRAQRLSRERADEIAHILAPPLAAKMRFEEAQPGEVQQSPGWFLLRVLRTFVYPPSAEEQAAMGSSPYGPAGAQRPPGTTPPPWVMPPYTLPAPPAGRPPAPGYGPPGGAPSSHPSYGPPPQGGYGPPPQGGYGPPQGGYGPPPQGGYGPPPQGGYGPPEGGRGPGGGDGTGGGPP